MSREGTGSRPRGTQRALREVSCELLKELIGVYVINHRRLRTQQYGQKRIVESVLKTIESDPNGLLPEDRLEEIEIHGSALRAASDHVASLTEPEAMALHGRLSGADPGRISDPL